MPKKIIFAQDDDPYSKKLSKLKCIEHQSRKGSKNHYSVKQLHGNENQNWKINQKIVTNIPDKDEEYPTSNCIKPC